MKSISKSEMVLETFETTEQIFLVKLFLVVRSLIGGTIKTVRFGCYHKRIIVIVTVEKYDLR